MSPQSAGIPWGQGELILEGHHPEEQTRWKENEEHRQSVLRETTKALDGLDFSVVRVTRPRHRDGSVS